MFKFVKIIESYLISHFSILLTVGFAIMALVYITQIPLTPFFVDEYHFIKKSIYLDEPLTPVDGYPLPGLKEEIAQPKVGPYIYGLIFKFSGIKNIYDYLEKNHFVTQSEWQREGWWVKYWEWPLQSFPAELGDVLKILKFQRVVSVAFSMMFLLCLFFVTKKFGDILFSIFAVFTIGTNHLVLTNGTLATTDSMLLCFSFVALLLVFNINRIGLNKITKTLFLYETLLGISLALATGVKISGILVYVFVLLYYVVVGFSQYLSKQRMLYTMLGILYTTAVFILILVTIHPHLHANTGYRLTHMFIDRYDGTKIAQEQYPKSKVATRLEALKLVATHTLLPYGSYVNYRTMYMPIDAALFICGLVLIVKAMVKDFKKKIYLNNHLILLLWFLVWFFGVVMYLKNNWSRYFIQPEVVVTIIEMYALAWCTKAYFQFTNKLLKYGIGGR